MQAHKGVGDHSMDNLFEDGNFLCKKICERPLIQGSFSIPVISFELTISGLGAEFLRKVKKIQKTVNKIKNFTIARAINYCVKKFGRSRLCREAFQIGLIR